VAGNSSDTVSVLLGNGNGTFTLFTTLTVSNASFPLAADFDGDGKIDLAVTSYGGQILVFRGNGNATFAAPVTYAVGSGARMIAAGDLDGDGRLDLITAGEFSDTLSVLRNTGSAFAAAVNYPISAPRWVVVDDYDRDGKLDVAVGSDTQGTIRVLRGNGAGALLTPAYAFGNVPSMYAIASGDMNGDGSPDLLAISESKNTVWVFLNTSH
jgi:hypothetical protein